MFYDFNKHKQQALESGPVTMQELVRRCNERRKIARQRYLAKRRTKNFFRLLSALQQPVFFTALGIGMGYCIFLVLPHSSHDGTQQSLNRLTDSHQTVQTATPSPQHQAFERYLDSLERASVADSIFQSQQTTEDHAENSIHP